MNEFYRIENPDDGLTANRSRSSSSPIKMLSLPNTPRKISGSFTSKGPSSLQNDFYGDITKLAGEIEQEFEDITNEEVMAAYLKIQEMKKTNNSEETTPEIAYANKTKQDEDYEQFSNIKEEHPASHFPHSPSPLFKRKLSSASDVKTHDSDEEQSVVNDQERDSGIFDMDL